VATTSIQGGGNTNVMVYGSGTVVAGNGNDGINILVNGKVTVGDGRDTINIGGNGTVVAGSGNDRIQILGNGSISVGGGHDTLTLEGSGGITQTGTQGHDTINLGYGNDTIYVQGSATVNSGSFPAYGRGRFSAGPFTAGHGTHAVISGPGATIAGGELEVLHVKGVTQDVAVSGTMTLLGGVSATEFIGGRGTTVMKGGMGNDTFIGGSGHDTMTGGSGHNLFEFLSSEQGGQHVITNFVSSDQLNVEGHSLSYLMSHGEVTTSDGNTYISIDGGKTTIELQGVTETDPLRQHIDPHFFRGDKF
jgi:Ca2+-binding RTX toxin-like protein